MTKVFTTETKVKLCGLYVREPFDYVFDKKDYDLFLQLFALSESLVLYTWAKMLEQLEYFLSLAKANAYYYQQLKQSEKKELYLPDRYSKDQFQEVMLKFLIEEICVFENARQNDYALNGAKRG